VNDDKYMGMDVHTETLVSLVLNAAGKEVARSILPTQAQPLLSFLQGLRGPLHVAMEEGTQAAWLYDLMEGRVAELVVCDARRHTAVRQGSKNDFGDARNLADLLRLGGLRPVYHGARTMRPLQEWAHSYRALNEDTTRAMNRIKALYRSRGIHCAGRGVYTQKQRDAWLERLPAGAPRQRAELLHQQLDSTRALRRRARRELLAESRKHTAAARLREIPGLGPLRVALLMARLLTPHRFRTRSKLWGYTGLGLITWDSAEHHGVDGQAVRRRQPPTLRGLNRNHQPELKDIFKAATLTAIHRPGPYKDYYDQRLAQGRDPSLLRLSVARKLAALVLRIWKKGGRYQADYLKPPQA
jgi:transposase